MIRVIKRPTRRKEDGRITAARAAYIGSSFDKDRKGQILTGLSMEEEKILLPSLLNSNFGSQNYYELKRLHYINMAIKVTDEGINLDNRLSKPDEELSVNNMPVNIQDYVLYKYIQAYRFVAKDKEELNYNTDATMYLVDTEQEELHEIEMTNKRDEAIAVYLKLKDSPEQIENALFTLWGVTEEGKKVFTNIELPFNLSKDKQKQIVQSIAQTNPIEFVKTLGKDFSKKAELYKYISLGIITREGSTFLFEDVAMGTTERDVYQFLIDPKNSRIYQTVKARTAEQEGKLKSGVI